MKMTAGKPTQISISIDTEFSIAGHFEDPANNQPVAEPAVYGVVDGREEALGFMLDTFARYQTKASFFVECANYFFFGDEPMQGVIKRLQAAGQDIQLHIHPVWLSFNKDPAYGEFPRHDDCDGRSFEELKRVFSTCIDVFERWVGQRPLAIRTGSLRADDTVYRVMAELGIPLSSNIALGVYQPHEPSLRHDSGRHRIHGVMELPVFSYQDLNLAGRRHKKSLQITSCSWPEMRHLLWKARRAGVENVVILTHPFEYVKKSDFRYNKLTRNRVNQQRLQKLCEFIHGHPQDFVSADFSEQHEYWVSVEAEHPYIEMPSLYAIGRKLHNKLNDMVWSY
ncbi:MAG: polysaccharide deacetylase family protein [Halioglobus sp.]|nr:polysaccharide deacetylase family protein [Halioglobus sp.]